jgi:DedD protein
LAQTATPEASEIRRRGRQRLIGAVTLVALLVVFVPMLLDSEPRRVADAPALTIPSRENAAPLPAPAPASAPVAAKPQPAPAAPAPAKVETAAAVTAAPSATPAPAAEPPRLAGFAVQVGAFRDEVKLKQARDKLVAAGVVHYTERLETKSGPLTRLRAGPYTSRDAAEGALVAIKRGALDGKVVPLP